MASSSASLMGSLNSGKLSDLKRRLLFVLGCLLVFRIGTHIPVPGINPDALAALFNDQKGGILDMFNMFSGGALGRFSVFSLGIMPYISASIVIGLMEKVSPTLERLGKEGPSGRNTLNQYKRYGTILIAAVQGIGISVALESQSAGGASIVIDPGWGFRMTSVIALVTGTMFLMWLGEQMTERGIGNGISLIICAGIIAGLPFATASTIELARTGEMHVFMVLAILLMVLAVVAFVVFIERGQRRISVHYAKRQMGRGQYAQQTSHLPLKVNMAGVIPLIFASALIMLPATLADWLSSDGSLGWLQQVSAMLSPGEPLYMVFYAAGIIFFCFFYTALQFKPEDTADNLKRSGAFIPGVRPGAKTAGHIDRIMSRLTLVGSIYMVGVAMLPLLLIQQLNVPFYFGGASVLIVVVVMMDFMSQIQAHLVSHHYDGLMKKANLKGYGPSGL